MEFRYEFQWRINWTDYRNDLVRRAYAHADHTERSLEIFVDFEISLQLDLSASDMNALSWINYGCHGRRF